MARKRKAGTAYPSSASASAHTARKKAKTGNGKKKQQQQGQDDDWDPDQEYEINAIIDEDATRYLIQWKDNPVTGEKYADDWQPKEFANHLAVEDWEATKKARRKRDSSPVQEVAPAAAPAAKKRGRSRKSLTVLSSSPEKAHERFQQVAQQQDDELEIGESQQTTGATDEVNEDSPLFVPENSPSPRPRQQYPQPSVHISDPPSSYAAGAYQNFSSSQIPESAAPKKRRTASPEPESSQVGGEFALSQQTPETTPLGESGEQQGTTRRKTPEASQWQPEEGDTSKTIENTTTTEASVAPTGSEPARSASVVFQRRANNVVPDSQSLPDSSSFQPSGTQTQSSSAPEARGCGRPPREVTQVALSQLPADTQDSWRGLSSLQPAVSQVESQPEVAAPTQESQAGIAAEAEEVQASQTPQESQAPDVTASQPQSHSNLAFASQVSARSEESQRGESSGIASRSTPPPNDEPPEPVPSGAEGAPQISQPSNHQSQILDEDIRPSTEQTDSGRIDLTRDTQSAPEQSSIALTPPIARHLTAARRVARDAAPGASLDSPFPFETQLPQQSSSTFDQSHGRLTQSQPAATTAARQLLPPWEPSNVTSVPSVSSPAQQISSSLPQPPTYSLSTFDLGREGAPPRSQTPSSPVLSSASAMSSPDPAGQAALEKIRAMRKRKTAESEAKLAKSAAARAAARSSASVASDASPPKSSVPPHVVAEASASVPAPAPPNSARLASPLLMAQDGSAPRSPSVVPAMEALPEITTEEMNTSEKYPTLLPQASIANEQDRTQRNGSLTGRATPTQQHQSPTQDPEAASAHAVPITLVGHQRDQYPQTVYYYQDLVRRFLEERNPDDRLVEKAEAFVERVRAITLHPDLDNAETFTQYDVEPEQQASWDLSCSAKFRFLKALLDGLRDEKMVVAVVLQRGRLVEILRTFLHGINVSNAATGDSSSSSSSSEVKVRIVTPDTELAHRPGPDVVVCLDNSMPYVDATMRSLRQREGSWCPFVSLVVPRSIEHIESHLSPGLSERARLRALVSGIDQLKGEAGRQEDGQLNPVDAANALVAYLKDPSPSGDGVWPLAGLSALHDLDSQTESEIEPLESTASPATGLKRQRIDEPSNVDDLNKRVRIEEASELPRTVNLQDVELTHISDSVNKTTQPHATDDVAQMDVEQRLQRLLQDALERNEGLTSALSDLQYRHEDQRALLIRTTSERDQLTATASDALLRRTEAQNRESALRTERTDLKKELEDANVRLLAHTVPERAETESLRQALGQADAEKATLEKRLEQARRQGDFFREQYQEASNTAQREVAANAELRGECDALRARASGEQAKLRQMGVDSRVERLEGENRKLKAVLRDREAGIKFRDEEIAKSRGRMGTRGTSVPRSPRLASPMGGAGVRSRQRSPAAGELKGKGSLLHPLRNNA